MQLFILLFFSLLFIILSHDESYMSGIQEVLQWLLKLPKKGKDFSSGVGKSLLG